MKPLLEQNSDGRTGFACLPDGRRGGEPLPGFARDGPSARQAWRASVRPGSRGLPLSARSRVVALFLRRPAGGTALVAKQPHRRPPRFERLATAYALYWLVRDTSTDIYYISWFDEEARQTRRRTLGTTSGVEAEKTARHLEKNGVTGDPKAFLNKKAMTLTGEVLDYYKKERVPKIRSGEAAITAIENYLRPRLGNIPVAALRKRDFRKFQDGMIEEGHTIGYVSR